MKQKIGARLETVKENNNTPKTTNSQLEEALNSVPLITEEMIVDAKLN
jgi:hypothetical protein